MAWLRLDVFCQSGFDIAHAGRELSGAEVVVVVMTKAISRMAKNIQSPEQELRFTRSGQATGFWLVAAILAAACITLFAASFYRGFNPQLPHPAWALAPLAIAIFAARLAWRMTRHAYLILTPLGIEIFPLLRPAAGMRLVLWQEIESMEMNAANSRLTLHHDEAKTSGVHLSLRPIAVERRALLIKALQGRIKSASSD